MSKLSKGSLVNGLLGFGLFLSSTIFSILDSKDAEVDKAFLILMVVLFVLLVISIFVSAGFVAGTLCFTCSLIAGKFGAILSNKGAAAGMILFMVFLFYLLLLVLMRHLQKVIMSIAFFDEDLYSKDNRTWIGRGKDFICKERERVKANKANEVKNTNAMVAEEQGESKEMPDENADAVVGSTEEAEEVVDDQDTVITEDIEESVEESAAEDAEESVGEDTVDDQDTVITEGIDTDESAVPKRIGESEEIEESEDEEFDFYDDAYISGDILPDADDVDKMRSEEDDKESTPSNTEE